MSMTSACVGLSGFGPHKLWLDSLVSGGLLGLLRLASGSTAFVAAWRAERALLGTVAYSLLGHATRFAL